MYLWQFYHNEYLSISKQHLYLCSLADKNELVNSRQMPNKKKMWLNSPHDSMFHAHILPANLIYAIDFIYPFSEQQFTSRKNMFHSFSHSHTFRAWTDAIFILSENTHTHTQLLAYANTMHNKKKQELWANRERASLDVSFFWFSLLSVVFIYIWRERRRIRMFGLVCMCFGLLWFTMSSVNATHNHIWIKIRVISTCCVYDILMINHPKLDGMLYVKCGMCVLVVVRIIPYCTMCDSVPPLHFSHNAKYTEFFLSFLSSAFFLVVFRCCCFCLSF